MAVEVIDLSSDHSDDENEQSPRKAVLYGFQPRCHKTPAVGSRGQFQYESPPVPQRNGKYTSAREASSEGEHKSNGAAGSGANARHVLNGSTLLSSEHDLASGVGRTKFLDPSQDGAIRQERIEGFHKFRQKKSSFARTKSQDPLVDALITRQNVQALHDETHNWNSTRSKLESLNRSKRPAQTPDDTPHGKVKRARKGEAPTPERRTQSAGVVLIDVTQSDTKRVTYSDEPELPTGTRPQATVDNSTEVRSPKVKKTPPRAPRVKGPSRHGLPYSAEEDELLRKLKDDDGLSWNEIVRFFNGRAQGSLTVRYYSNIRNGRKDSVRRPRVSETTERNARDDEDVSIAQGRSKRRRKSNVPSEYVSWASLKQKDPDSRLESFDTQVTQADSLAVDPFFQQDRTFSSSLLRNLRCRELGLTTRRAWNGTWAVTAEMTNHMFNDYRIQKQYYGTSGDVVALSWSPDGSRFAAGSIAISDPTSMQYNMPRNLLLGDHDELLELPDHNVPRPAIEEQKNVNALHAMRESQDPRLFMTVTATGFSPDGNRLLTAGADKMLRQYTASRSLERVKCRYAIEHPAPVDLLAIHPLESCVATGCHSAFDNIRVLGCGKVPGTLFVPGQDKALSQSPLFPSALKWGVAQQHHRFLLAGFSGEFEKEAGETRLWDVEHQRRIELHATTRNVFDVAWNPRPSAASISFIVASNPTTINVSSGTRSVIQCFALDQAENKRVLAWESPAMDVNDVVMCPYDENLVAAGATDGTVYVWDYRYVSRSQHPLHTLKHGRTENVIDDDRDLEEADTGVRFLSWGATKDRLYSGSSDGTVKVWNPYRSPGNTCVDDITTSSRGRSAVMSGSFSPDYRELLIGRENGLIDLFEAGGQAVYKAPSFKLRPTVQALPEEEDKPFAAARALLKSKMIELRPFGAMPVRQAVQGTNYIGPFMAPSSEEVTQAEKIYYGACRSVNEADDEDRTKANLAIDRARAKLVDLGDRKQHFETAQPKARAFQLSLLLDEKERTILTSRLSHAVEPCQLDCAVLRSTEEGEADDSGQSSFRIPDSLRNVAQLEIAAKDPAEQDGHCFSCNPVRANFGKTCAKCSLQKQGFTTVCKICSGPARVSTGDTIPGLCEKCGFACFRCGEPMMVSPAVTRVTCPPCGHTWEVGALGFDLATPLTFRPKQSRALVSSDDEAWDAFGSEEREHYAGLTQENPSE